MEKFLKIISSYISFVLKKNEGDLPGFKKKTFTDIYSLFIMKNDKPEILQTYTKDDPKKVIYYTTDPNFCLNKPFNNEKAWIVANEEGIFFTESNTVKVQSKESFIEIKRTTHRFSWNYNQNSKCLPYYGKHVKDEMPKTLRKSYPKTPCCILIETDWIKRPVYDIICSVKSNPKACAVEILILRATIYKRCMKNSINSVLSNTDKKRIDYPKAMKTLKNLPKMFKKIPKIIKQKLRKLPKLVPLPKQDFPTFGPLKIGPQKKIRSQSRKEKIYNEISFK